MAAVDSFQLLYREVSRSCGSCVESLALVGALYTASRAVVLLTECCSLVRVHFLPRIIPNKKLAQRFGDWAVISDASQPVAKAYAEELAKHGINVAFITRDAASLQDAAVSFSQSYGVESAVIVADFSLGQASVIKPVQETLRNKDVGFLVNCVDEASASPLSLIEMSDHFLLGQINRNVGAAALMTRLVLPGMLQRGRGAVVNISPGANCRPRRGAATLSAISGYLDSFSKALHFEYSSRGVFIQSLIPLQIASPGLPNTSSRGSWFAPRPEVYARHAVSTLGISNRTTGYWPHTLQYGLMTCVPEWLWILGSRMHIFTES